MALKLDLTAEQFLGDLAFTVAVLEEVQRRCDPDKDLSALIDLAAARLRFQERTIVEPFLVPEPVIQSYLH